MSKPKIEERVAALEVQMQRVLARSPQPGPDDWKSVVGMCTGLGGRGWTNGKPR